MGDDLLMGINGTSWDCHGNLWNFMGIYRRFSWELMVIFSWDLIQSHL
jgi:hypothetical protein